MALFQESNLDCLNQKVCPSLIQNVHIRRPHTDLKKHDRIDSKIKLDRIDLIGFDHYEFQKPDRIEEFQKLDQINLIRLRSFKNLIGLRSFKNLIG